MAGEFGGSKGASSDAAAAAVGRAVVDALDEGVFEVDGEYRVADVNDALVAATGFDRETLVGRRASRLVAADDESAVASSVRAVASGGGDETLDVAVETADGGRRPMELRLRGVEATGGDSGESRAAVGVLADRDGGERARLGRERDLNDRVLESSPVGITVMGPDGSMVRSNRRMQELVGVPGESSAEYSKENVVLYDEDGDRLDPAAFPSSRVFETGEPVFDWTGQVEQPDGDRRWVSVNAVPLGDGDDGVERVVVTAEDVTERREREESLRRERERFRSMVQAVKDYAIFLLDAEGRVTTWNEGAERIKGYDREDVIGEHFSTFYTAEDREAGVPEANLARAAERGRYEDEDWRVRADGTEFWANVTITALYDDDGDVRGFTKVTRDVTERREYEQRLRAERDLNESVLEASPMSVIVVDDDGEVEKANSRAERRLGIDDGGYEVGDRPVFDEDGEFVPPEERPYLDVFETGEPVENWQCQLETAAGDRRWVSVNARPMSGGEDVERVVVTGEDVTELKETQRALARERDELESELSELLGRVTDAFFALDDDWEFSFVNDRAVDLLDRSEADLLGENVWEAFSEAVDTTFEREYRRAMEDQEPVHFEEYFPPLETWFSVSAYPSETGLSVYFRDVTDRKHHEQALAALHGVTRGLPHAEMKADVAERVVAAASDVLDLSGVAVYLRDGDADDLYPAAHSEDVSRLYGELPRVEATADSSVTANAFVGGETVEYADIRESELLVGDVGSVRRCVFVPLGDHGVFVAGDDEVGEFDDRTVELAELLVANAESAMDRVDREIELRERERDLELYETIVETVDDGICVLDGDCRFTMVNDAFADVLALDRDEIVGASVADVLPDEATATAEDLREVFVESDDDGNAFELEMVDAGGEERVLDLRASVLDDENGVESIVSVVRDVTERKERERELERYETLVETIWDGVYALDDDGEFVMVNDAFLDMTGWEREELLGRPADVVHSEEVDEAASDLTASVAGGDRDVGVLEFDLRRRDGDTVPVESRFGPYPYGDDYGRCGVVRDVSERLERERELRDRMRQQQVTAELGRLALEEPDLDRLFAEATERVAETLETDYCKVLDVDDDVGELLLRQGVGWQDGYVGEATVAADENSQVGYTLRTEEPVIVEDVAAESRFSGPGLLVDHGVQSGVSTVIGSSDDPWGVLGAHDTERREFSEQDVNFLESVANVLATAVHRNRRVREIERQRQHLATLDNLNGVVRDINAALVESSTREEIERVVCERLVDADEYAFAWVGDVDRSSGEVTPTVWAGDGEGYLDDVPVSVDDPETARGPTGRAVETMEMQSTPSFDVEDAEPWRDAAVEHGFESSAAIPLVYEGALYGVLNVYARRPAAFEGREGEVVAQLGDVVGHAIRAVERKEALMTEAVVELEFRSRSVLEPVLDCTSDGGAVRFERTISRDEDEYLQYVTIDGVAESAFLDAVERSERLSSPRLVAERGDGVLFEVTMTRPPLTLTVASYGGRVRETTVESGELRLVAELPHSVDIRTLVSAVEDAVADVELVSQRSIQREDRTPLRRTAMESLTDKQLAAVEAAFFAGYFDWPRDSTAEELAESLGVSAPTLHQHLRKGERKLLAGYFEG